MRKLSNPIHSRTHQRRISRAIAQPLESRTLLSGNPLDTTFGDQGSVTGNPLLFVNGAATAVHVLSNGDILVGGYGQQGGYSDVGLEAARYLPDGELDTTFGTYGLVYIPVTSVGRLTGMAVTPAGDIVLAAPAYSNSTIVVRLTPNGALDPTFGTGGIYTTGESFGAGGYYNYKAYLYGANVLPIALGSDGSIYLGGTNYNTDGTTRFSMLKVNAAGTHSYTFNYSIQAYSGASAIVYSGGKLVLGGFSSMGAPGSATDSSQFTLLGVNTNGTINHSFGEQGIVRTDIEVTSDIEAMAVSPNGDIVAVGNSINDGSELYSFGGGSILSDIALARYKPSGQLDPTFGTSGIAVTFGGDTAVVGAREFGLQSVTTPSVAVETDGSIAVAGNILQGDEGLFLAIHYSAAGNLLASGKFDVTSEISPESFFAVDVQGNNIFAAGYLDLESPPIEGDGSELILAKFNPDLTLRAGFAVDQSISIPRAFDSGDFLPTNIAVGNPDGYFAAGGDPTVIHSAQETNGQIVVLGPGYSYTTYNFESINVHLARYNPNGTRDLTFQPDGNAAGTALAVQSDGKILVAGDPIFGFHRLNSDGSVDPLFTATGPDLSGTASIVELQNGDLLVAVGADVYRFLPDGTFDTTFGIAGVATNANLIVSDMAVKHDGSIVVVGGETVEEFTAAGLVDTGFNTTGQVTLTDTVKDSNSDTDPATAVVIDSQGNILVGGSHQVVALSADGSFDPAFGNDGVRFIFTPSTAIQLEISSLALDSYGNVLVGGIDLGVNYYPGEQDLVRLTPVGKLDATFGDDGFVDVMPAGSYPSGYSVIAVDSNAAGQIYLVGLLDVNSGDVWSVTLSRFYDGPSVSGTVFSDHNGDGKQQAGDVGMAGRTIYGDLNNNSKLDPGEPSTVTDSKGKYTLYGLPSGALLIRQILQAGQRESTTAYGGAFHVTLGNTPLTNINFGSTNTIYIAGKVFIDTNGNGKLDANEHGLANVRMFIDRAKTGNYVASDPSVFTDASGNFAFTGLVAGPYVLRIVTPGGFVQTSLDKKTLRLQSGGVSIDSLFSVRKIV